MTMNHSDNKQKTIFVLLSIHLVAILSSLLIPSDLGSSLSLFGKTAPIGSVLIGILILSTWWVSCLATQTWGFTTGIRVLCLAVIIDYLVVKFYYGSALYDFYYVYDFYDFAEFFKPLFSSFIIYLIGLFLFYMLLKRFSWRTALVISTLFMNHFTLVGGLWVEFFFPDFTDMDLLVWLTMDQILLRVFINFVFSFISVILFLPIYAASAKCLMKKPPADKNSAMV